MEIDSMLQLNHFNVIGAHEVLVQSLGPVFALTDDKGNTTTTTTTHGTMYMVQKEKLIQRL